MSDWKGGEVNQIEDYYEGRIASLKTGIEMVLHTLEPSLLSDAQRVELAQSSLKALLDSDFEKSLQSVQLEHEGGSGV